MKSQSSSFLKNSLLLRKSDQNNYNDQNNDINAADKGSTGSYFDLQL